MCFAHTLDQRTVTATVIDAQGLAVPNATVRLATNVNGTETYRTVLTNSSGGVSILNVPPEQFWLFVNYSTHTADNDGLLIDLTNSSWVGTRVLSTYFSVGLKVIC